MKKKGTRPGAATSTTGIPRVFPFFLFLLFLAVAGSGFTASAQDEVPSRHINVGIAAEPGGLDITVSSAAALVEIAAGNIYECLTAIDRNGRLKPALAESWQVSTDLLQHTFTLRHGVKFHDGSDFTAADVVFTVEKALAGPDTEAKKIFEDIQYVFAVEDTVVKFRLKKPNGLLARNLSGFAAAIVSKNNSKDNALVPNGTGPYRFDSRRKREYIRLRRFDGYHGRIAYFESADFVFAKDSETAVFRLEEGEIDFFPNFPWPESLNALRSNPALRVETGNSEIKLIAVLNNAGNIFSNPGFRRAATMAVDKQEIIDAVTSGLANPIGSHYSPHLPGYVDLNDLIPYDPAGAKKIVNAGKRKLPALRFPVPPPGFFKQTADLLIPMLEKAGFSVKRTDPDWQEWQEQIYRKRNYDITLLAYPNQDGLDLYARRDYFFGYANKIYRKIFENYEQEQDESLRALWLESLQRKISADAANIFLFLFPKITVSKAELTGFRTDGTTRANLLAEIYPKKAP